MNLDKTLLDSAKFMKGIKISKPVRRAVINVAYLLKNYYSPACYQENAPKYSHK